MAMKVLLAASLRKYVPGYDAAVGLEMELEPGATVVRLVEELGIPADEVKLIMVNGLGAKWETVLQGDDRVALFPPVGGG